jgi:hypothetical protein
MIQWTCVSNVNSTIIFITSVVKIASWLAESAEFTTYPSLSERNRAQNRRRRGSVPDRRSESHNRRNGVRSDSDQCARGGRKKRVVLVFYQTHRFVIITKQKRTVSFIWLFLILFFELILIIPKRHRIIKRFSFILIPFFSFHRFLSFFFFLFF